MAEGSGSGGISVLSFLVGALLIAVVGLGIFLATGGRFGAPASEGPSLNVKIDAPAKP